jgi:hypothetical protein
MGVVALGRSFFFLFLSFWFLYLIIPLFPGILFPPPSRATGNVSGWLDM